MQEDKTPDGDESSQLSLIYCVLFLMSSLFQSQVFPILVAFVTFRTPAPYLV